MSDAQSKKILQEGLAAMGIPLDEQAQGRLVAYCGELLRWSAKINLVAKAELREIWESHFLDSLSLLRVLPVPESVQPPLLDIGSGAGFPGLALKAARPELPVILVEPRQKRVSFLRHVIRTLGLNDIEVLCGRLEKNSSVVDGTTLCVPIVTSRAFTNLGEFLLHTEAVNPVGGRVICMKGPRAEEEIATWRSEQPHSPYRLQEIVTLTLPFSGKVRNLVIFSKEGA
ncbi:16S rRNA (guanine(527)-N(7))-methyltransferase RsmG [Thiovibrio frasassiensis]|uniref:Ribosomal RNA small subunit methyltransferase G n=1 Tax=Thiovibrio frasassiensis TaxID=2984131 RepID=A0A9X4MHZ7_9BACT|nr:16S rRNA (guanine(527)-N(7))-methyltransferase RsmG [Thiovibrio frasassiensis]MDG4475888.1 16S rRNA (guanine(527)-N(7))-methyltransferase RsmG [Thiovibrio frasassiensis]